jgi:hypothetical protein
MQEESLEAISPLSYTSTKLLLDNLEAVGRIALPMISFAGRRLAVLATPPQTHLPNLERKAGLEPALSFLACPEQLSEAKCRTGWQRRVLATRRLPPGASSES